MGPLNVSALLLVTAIVLSGCAAYPTTRTFYEVDPADGTPTNRSSCGYTSTRDSVKRLVQGIEIHISPGSENLPTKPSSTLNIKIGFAFPDGKTNVIVDPEKIQLDFEGAPLKPSVVNLSESSYRRWEGPYKWKSIELLYPPPSGLRDRLTIIFQPGALRIDGQAVTVAPFRFNRVTKSDIYYGSINC